ncbi:hypothetical protein E2320_002317, partial [Naja naja]
DRGGRGAESPLPPSHVKAARFLGRIGIGWEGCSKHPATITRRGHLFPWEDWDGWGAQSPLPPSHAEATRFLGRIRGCLKPPAAAAWLPIFLPLSSSRAVASEAACP